MSHVEITLKAGNLIKADVTEFSIQKNALGSVVGMKWTTPGDENRALMHLDISEVTSVVFVDGEDSEKDGHEGTPEAIGQLPV
jgi:hypothetical protein